MDGEREPNATEVRSGAMGRLVEFVRERVTLPRAHSIIGIIAGCLSITLGIYSYLHLGKPVPLTGDVVAIVQDGRTGRPLPDATVEVLTSKDAVVTTLAPGTNGQARGKLKEGTYRLRVTHPRFVAETRQVQVVSGQISEVHVRLVPPAPPPKQGPVDDAVGAVKKLFK
jgi:Carboxypeptidase regulatory-like domain